MGRPDCQALTVRTVTEADVDGLDALFQGLSDDDRHHRFFSLRPPARTFLEQMTRAEAEGGYRLVAVASGAEDALVAEAGYAILPDGARARSARKGNRCQPSPPGACPSWPCSSWLGDRPG
jgi:hypothetical protein